MEKIIVAAVSVKNLIGQADAAIDNMRRWAIRAGEKGAELILFPELNVSGYIFSPWGRVMAFVDREGNDESMVVEELGPDELADRRNHPNFLAKELRPELYQFR